MKIIRTDCELECPRVDGALREAGHELVLLPEGVSEPDLIAAVRDAGLILMCYTPITSTVIDAAPHLKGIVKYGVGIDAVDIPAAIARKVPVVNIPLYAEETVAEGAFALLIALARKLVPLSREMEREGWAWPTQRWLGSDIAGKTLGLIGVGHIGRSVARMAGAGFRARVLGYNPGKSAEELRAAGVEKRDDLHAMLGECDFVSVHCVLNDDTRGMIGAAEFAAMKPGALFVNVSRGAIADEAALLEALRSGHLGGAALDVFGQEPLDRRDHPLAPLFGMENVILSPHLTFYTRDAMTRLEEETLARCAEIIEGRPVTIRSLDPRLRAQHEGVVFAQADG
ncbi:C-terminal binding protein [Roseovarius sp. SCSIO 43702]|uniref:2-hydroxyacid dehydrogenase n=1 Tax=Roseovarius sp. SCSIO 43702 TaxID=2823043 RepID=UPI001C72DFB9|nr:C-terminal binding protein [Roseovarius sp. SCSIO 43702]QYX55361.1 C-terminal binding protein [Roseovarius sp. SCSIO 43702]